MRKFRTFDELVVEHLQKEGPAFALSYLNSSLEEDDVRIFLIALKRVIEAYGGIGTLAKKTSLNRTSLYTLLSKKGNPELKTVGNILDKLGFKFVIAQKKIKTKKK